MLHWGGGGPYLYCAKSVLAYSTQITQGTGGSRRAASPSGIRASAYDGTLTASPLPCVGFDPQIKGTLTASRCPYSAPLRFFFFFFSLSLSLLFFFCSSLRFMILRTNSDILVRVKRERRGTGRRGG